MRDCRNLPFKKFEEQTVSRGGSRGIPVRSVEVFQRHAEAPQKTLPML